jgi:hypothetical protein
MRAADEVALPRALRAGLKFVDRLIDALVDPARRETTALILLVAYAVIWTLYGVVAKAGQDVQFDAAELVAWSHHPALGYSKHPPFAAWLLYAWFSVFPIRDWAYYLFAMIYVTFGLWVTWRLLALYLDPAKRVVGLACLMLIPYFNLLSLRFDHNAVLGPLWAMTALCFMRSYDTRSPKWAALAGAAAALAMLGKYWSLFLLVGLAVAVLTDARRASYFRSSAPWITVAVGALLLAPHLLWLVQHNFIPLTYAVDAHAVKHIGHSLYAALGFLAGGAGYAAVPVILVLAFSRPSRAAVADMLLPGAPERRFAATAFWTTLLLPPVVAILFGFEINSLWTMSAFVLLPIVLLSSPLLEVNRRAMAPVVLAAAALPLVMLAAAPGIAIGLHISGLHPTSTNAELLAKRIEQEWRRTTDRPLRIVGGDFDLSNVTVFYLPGQPSALPVMEPETVPWVTPERVEREGVAMVCHLNSGQNNCVSFIRQAIDKFVAHNPPPRRAEVAITPDFWGIRGKPTRYLIEIVPPKV